MAPDTERLAWIISEYIARTIIELDSMQDSARSDVARRLKVLEKSLNLNLQYLDYIAYELCYAYIGIFVHWEMFLVAGYLYLESLTVKRFRELSDWQIYPDGRRETAVRVKRQLCP